MASDVRPVWLTREQRDYLADLAKELQVDNERVGFGAWGGIGHLLAIVNWWDAAPADATEAVRVLVQTIASLRDPLDAIDETTAAVLRAFGVPEAA